MVDYKPLPTSEKGEKEVGEIPPPVQATSQQAVVSKKYKRIFAFVKHLAAFSVLYVCLVYWGRQLKAEVDAEASAWLSNPFASFHHRHGKGHKVLNGKAAEELFM